MNLYPEYLIVRGSGGTGQIQLNFHPDGTQDPLVGPFTPAAPQFTRITEAGDRRILENGVDVRVTQ